MKSKNAKSEGKAVVMASKKKGKSPFEVASSKGDIKIPEEGSGKRRLDRPGRKLGGRVGADVAPLSSAAKTTRC